MIKCKICGKELKILSNGHLQKIHKITPEEYLKIYPTAELVSTEFMNIRSKIQTDLWKDSKSVYNSKEFREEKGRQNLISRKDFPDSFLKAQQDASKTMKDNWEDLDSPWRDSNRKDKASNSMKKTWTDTTSKFYTKEYRTKKSIESKERWQDPSYKDRVSKNIKSGLNTPEIKNERSIRAIKYLFDSECNFGTCKNFKRGYFFSHKNNKTFFYRSSWEELFMQQLEEDSAVDFYDVESLVIKYMFEGGTHRYIPDFLINGSRIVEIKPKFRLTEPKVIAKAKAGIEYATKNSMTYEIVSFK